MRRAKKPPREPRGPSRQRLCCLLAFCVLAVCVPLWFKGRTSPPALPTASLHDLRRPARPARPAPQIGDGLVSQWTEIASLSWYHTDKLDKDELASDAAKAEERARSVAACFRREPGNGARLWGTDQRKKRLIFVHVPKCGGSALTATLRRLACVANGNPTNPCCSNPGFCQRNRQKMRLCPDVLNCHSHQPQLSLFFGARSPNRHLKAVTMVREPLGRVVSAWHYRCHNPNWDCFHIDGSVQWAERKRLHDDWYVRPPNASDVLPWVSFGRFLDMEHYQNIQTRMLGSDRFPYSPTRVEALDVQRAISRIDAHFAVVGVFELFEHSAALIAVLAGVPVDPADLVRVRAQHTAKYAEFTSTLKGDAALAAKVLEKNVHDQTLHREASVRLCRQLRENDLLELPGCADPAAAKARAFCAKVL